LFLPLPLVLNLDKAQLGVSVWKFFFITKFDSSPFHTPFFNAFFSPSESSWNVAGGVVSIPSGTTYLLSSSPGVLLKSVTISGELIIDNKDIDLGE